MHDPANRDTKYLNSSATNTDAFLPVRATTGPLNEPLPWVIEFRVVGTPASIQVQVNDAMLIGRADPQRGVTPAIDLAPHGGQHKGVSRQHALITVKDNRINIRDMNSVNGTRLNGALLAPMNDYRLRHGDELHIGQVKLQVRFAVVPTMGTVPKTDHLSEKPQMTIPQLGRGESILIVEGDAQVSKVFSTALKHAGFQVKVAENGEMGLGYIAQEAPALLIVELILPDMNGLDLMRSMHKQANTDKIQTIVCSGATGGFQMHEALNAGAKLFLGKPVSVDDLLKAVKQVLRPELETPALP
jgi:CheY-like chemotaxis protein